MSCLTDKQELEAIISTLLVKTELCSEGIVAEWQSKSPALLASVVFLATTQDLVKVDMRLLLRALQQVEDMVVMEPVVLKHLEHR